MKASSRSRRSLARSLSSKSISGRLSSLSGRCSVRRVGNGLAARVAGRSFAGRRSAGSRRATEAERRRLAPRLDEPALPATAAGQKAYGGLGDYARIYQREARRLEAVAQGRDHRRVGETGADRVEADALRG